MKVLPETMLIFIRHTTAAKSVFLVSRDSAWVGLLRRQTGGIGEIPKHESAAAGWQKPHPVPAHRAKSYRVKAMDS